MLKGLLKPKSKPVAAPAPAPAGVPPAYMPAGGSSGSPAGSAALHSDATGAYAGAGSSAYFSAGGVGSSTGIPHAASHPTHATTSMGMIESTPRADVLLPHAVHKRERRRSSVVREERATILKELPLLKDAPANKREQLFKQKLAMCSVLFNWDDPESDKRGKELKRLTLLELVDYISSPSGQKMFTEAMMDDIGAMVSANIFRTLPGPGSGSGGEESAGLGGGEDGEEEAYADPAWPHLQLVYEFLLRFIVSGEVKAKSAKKVVDTAFCSKFIAMFDSEDARERDYLKTILHRIYGKFMTHRSFIRKAISFVFYEFVYETERHNGIGELLEILGSIINGFALPLKPEHITFLEKALIPLHRPRSIQTYFQQLCYCVTQYVEKDASTAAVVINGLVRSWPWSSSAKQITLLNELEEILELTPPPHLAVVMRPLFRTLARCVGSTHFQVAERALFLWNNEALLTHGVLSKMHAAEVLPLLYSSLQKNAQGHWNTTVETLAQNVLKHYMDADPALYERCAEAAAAEAERAVASPVAGNSRTEASLPGYSNSASGVMARPLSMSTEAILAAHAAAAAASAQGGL